MIKHKSIQDKVVAFNRITMFTDRLYDYVFQSAHLVLHYQANLVGLIFVIAKIDISTLVVKRKTKDSLFTKRFLVTS